MRAIMVCVDYADLLAITLPYNRHHFEDVMVVTSNGDRATQDVCARLGVRMFPTSSFYADGATFNKWRALEEGLDAYGRHGWLCIMDADVLWPKNVLIPFRGPGKREIPGACIGNLYTPIRRMWEDWPQLSPLMGANFHKVGGFMEERAYPIPLESEWSKFPIHRNLSEFAGYSQIFHTSDPVLGPAPWHEVDWKHAGGADSFFQAKWPAERKVRPPFEILHLGPAGMNWYGRATPLVDGTVPEDAGEKLAAVSKIWSGRRENRAAGRDQFEGEKIS